MARPHRSRRRLLYRYVGPVMLVAGALSCVYPFVFLARPVTSEFLAISLLGVAAMATGWAVSLAYWMSRLAHEILLRLDGERDDRPGHVARNERDTDAAMHTEDDSTPPPSGTWLRELSTRDLRLGWRLLVVAPVILGGALLLLTVIASQAAALGNLVSQSGLRLEHLCVGGLALIMLGACLMPLGGVVSKQANRGEEEVGGTSRLNCGDPGMRDSNMRVTPSDPKSRAQNRES